MASGQVVVVTVALILLMEVSGTARSEHGQTPARDPVNMLSEMSWTRGPDLVMDLAWGEGGVRPRPWSSQVTPGTPDTTGSKLGSEVPNLGQPQFDNNTTVAVFAPRGGTATIECHVSNLGDRAVSWIRKRDLHILTIGSITYTADRRFTSVQNEDSTVWQLTIEPTLHTDSGMYECQISTEPKISKLHILNITDAVSEIQSGRSVYVREGSLLNVTCLTRGQLTLASHIYWYRGTSLLNTSERGGISINSDKVTGWSNLVIWNSRLSDSGDYSCRPSNALPDTVSIHVLTGDELAAIQEPEGLTGGHPDSLVPGPQQALVSLALLAWLCSPADL